MPNPILPSPTFFSYSLGCRTNQAEMESIGLQLTDYGLRQIGDGLPTTDRQPDLVLINTCVVTQKAEKETRQKIRELRKKYPKSFLVVMGCGVTAKEKFKNDLPKADLFISNENKDKTVQYIKSKLLFEQSREQSTEFFSTPPITIGVARRITLLNKYIQSGRKFIKIQDGCDCECSFCLTQFLRGKPTSVPPEKIIEEINFWVEKGIKEIILTGINLGLYGKDAVIKHVILGRIRQLAETTPESDSGQARMTIANLVKQILTETNISRISFSSIYPEMLTSDFVKLVINNPRISQYFHLSLQSGSQTVLKRMNRKTDLSRLKQTLSRIKAENKYFTFKADIIVGFPGETEKEFRETLDFIKKAKISFAHIFTFSARKGTTAYKLINSGKWHEATEDIKKERTHEITSAIENIRNNEAKKMIGSSTNCLIVKKTPSSFRAHSTPSITLRINSLRASSSRACLPAGRESLSLPKRDPSTSPPIASSVGMTKNLNINFIDSRSRPSGLSGMTRWEGLTENGWNIKIMILSEKDIKILSAKGKIVPVKITGFEKDYLIGEITSLPTN